jgi:hypothetical protein
MPPQQVEAGLDRIGEVGELGAHGGMSVVSGRLLVSTWA